MAHSLSAQKRVRQNAKHRARNRWRKDRIHTAIKGFLATLHAGDTAKAADLLKSLYKLLDRMAGNKTIHKNAAARYKSRLTGRLNKAAAPKKAA